MNQTSENHTLPRIIRASSRMWAVNATALIFILLQSVCSAVIALSGVGVALGLGSLATALGLNRLTGTFHTDAIRIPMMTIALLGSLTNLYVLWRVRRLRARPASQWRIVPLSPKQRRSEIFRFSLSLITIALVLAEAIAHLYLHPPHH